jgi:hypothetical protein
MKVICIEKCTEYVGKMPYWYSPEVGDELTVLSVEEHYGRTFYDLDGYPEFLYDSKFFATLPEPDADNMKEEEQQAIVNLQHA